MASILSVEEVLDVAEEFIHKYAPRVKQRRVLARLRHEDENDPLEGFDRRFMALDVSLQMLHAAVSDLKMDIADLSNKFAQPNSLEGLGADSAKAVDGVTRITKRKPKTYCSMCHKDFSSNQKLKEHYEKTHGREDKIMDEKSYCVVCKKQLNNKPYLKMHMAVQHGMSSPWPLRKKRKADVVSSDEMLDPEAYCHFCKKQFHRKNYLAVHQAYQHGISSKSAPTQVLQPDANAGYSEHIPNPNLYCDVCNKEFSSKGYLTKHKAYKHGITSQSPRSEVKNPSAYCFLCCKQLCNKSYLQTHHIMRHGMASPDLTQKSQDNIPIRLPKTAFTVEDPTTSDANSRQYIEVEYLEEEDLSAMESSWDGLVNCTTSMLPP